MLITVAMVILSHIGACSIMAIAMSQLEQSPPVRDLWLTFDGIVEFDNDCMEPPCDTYHFTKPLYYVFIRAFYWAVVTCVSFCLVIIFCVLIVIVYMSLL